MSTSVNALCNWMGIRRSASVELCSGRERFDFVPFEKNLGLICRFKEKG